MMHLVDSARGALKLYALQLRPPRHVSATTKPGRIGQDALTGWTMLHSSDLALGRRPTQQPRRQSGAVTQSRGPGNCPGVKT